MIKQPHLTFFSWYKQTKKPQNPSFFENKYLPTSWHGTYTAIEKHKHLQLLGDLRLFGRFNKRFLMTKVYSASLWHDIRNLDQPFLQKETIHYTKGSANIGGNFLQVCRGKMGDLQERGGLSNGRMSGDVWHSELTGSMKEMLSCFLSILFAWRK